MRCNRQSGWRRDAAQRGVRQVCRANPAANQRLYERYLRNRRAKGGVFLDDSQLSQWSPGAALAGLWPPLGPPQPVGAGDAPPSPLLMDDFRLQQLLELYRLMPEPPKQRPRRQPSPGQLPDAVPPEQLPAALERLNERKAGIVIEPPQLPAAQAGARAPLPPLVLPPGAPTHVRVHVFWDVESLSVGGADPRVAVQQLRALLGSYGQLAGIYAYGVRQAFTWIPDAFMQRYGASSGEQPGPAAGAAQAAARSAAASPAEPGLLGPSRRVRGLGPLELRCPTCGIRVTQYKSLQVHMKRVHKQRAPPLETLLEAGGAAARGALVAGLEGPTRGSSGRSLGKVVAYWSSGGQLFAPAPGHQMTLKYALLREGVHIRLVQNYREDVQQAVAGGVGDLLRQLQLRSPPEAAVTTELLVLASDRPGAEQLLQQVAAAGHGAGLVASGGRRGARRGAALVLDWRRLVGGGYEQPAEQPDEG